MRIKNKSEKNNREGKALSYKARWGLGSHLLMHKYDSARFGGDEHKFKVQNPSCSKVNSKLHENV